MESVRVCGGKFERVFDCGRLVQITAYVDGDGNEIDPVTYTPDSPEWEAIVAAVLSCEMSEASGNIDLSPIIQLLSGCLQVTNCDDGGPLIVQLDFSNLDPDGDGIINVEGDVNANVELQPVIDAINALLEQMQNCLTVEPCEGATFPVTISETVTVELTADNIQALVDALNGLTVTIEDTVTVEGTVSISADSIAALAAAIAVALDAITLDVTGTVSLDPSQFVVGVDCDGEEVGTGLPVVVQGVVDICPQPQAFCKKWTTLAVGLDNTGTRFNQTLTIELTNNDGSKTTIQQTPTAGWTQQIEQWAASLAIAYPDCDVEPRCNIAGGCGGLLGPVSDAPLPKMFARYVHLSCCPTGKFPISAKVVDGKSLVVDFNQTPEKRGYVCVDCAGNVGPLRYENGEVVPAADLPACTFDCAESFPELPEAPLNVLLGCDDGTDPATTIVATVEESGAVSYYVDDGDGGLAEYTLVGQLVDCTTGEPLLDCETTETCEVTGKTRFELVVGQGSETVGEGGLLLTICGDEFTIPGGTVFNNLAADFGAWIDENTPYDSYIANDIVGVLVPIDCEGVSIKPGDDDTVPFVRNTKNDTPTKNQCARFVSWSDCMRSWWESALTSVLGMFLPGLVDGCVESSPRAIPVRDDCVLIAIQNNTDAIELLCEKIDTLIGDESDECPCDDDCDETTFTLFSKFGNPHPQAANYPGMVHIGSLVSGPDGESTHPGGALAGIDINGWNVFAICATELPDDDQNLHYWIEGEPSSFIDSLTYEDGPNADPNCCDGSTEPPSDLDCNDLAISNFDPDRGSRWDVLRWNGTDYSVSPVPGTADGGWIEGLILEDDQQCPASAHFAFAHVGRWDGPPGGSPNQVDSGYILVARNQVSVDGSGGLHYDPSIEPDFGPCSRSELVDSLVDATGLNANQIGGILANGSGNVLDQAATNYINGLFQPPVTNQNFGVCVSF